MEPKIVTKTEFKVVGMRYYGDNRNNEIKALWDRFFPKIQDIEHRVNPEISYGVCYPAEDETENSEFEYIAAVEVNDFGEVPEGMIGKTVPARKYAVFTHKGSVDRISETYKYIYGTWQPKSDCELVKSPDFEYYDARFDPDNQEASELDIYIPIQ